VIAVNSAHAAPLTRELGGEARAGVFHVVRPLVLILGLQSVISVTTLRNTAFQDEGLYLYAGRQLLRSWTGGPPSLDHYAFYFSGYPGVYPVIGGLLDFVGGLELARAFSLLCMLGVTSAAYFATKMLFQRTAAVFAGALYALSGTVLYLGRLATFDALCLFLIALATALSLYLSTGRRPWVALALGPVLVLAILAKYAAMLLVPTVLGLLAVSCVVFLGWRPMVRRLALAVGGLVLSIAVAYEVIDRAAFHAIGGSTTNRSAVLLKPRLDLFTHVLVLGGIVYLAAAVGLVLVMLYSPRLRLIALLLFGSAWLMPAYHIYKREAISIDKHVAFSLFFAVPLAGYALAWLAGYVQRPAQRPRSQIEYWLAAVAVVLAVCTLGLQQSRAIYATWANTSELSYALHTQFRNGAGRILSEDIEVARYDARDVTQQWQWNGVNYFYYVNSKHRQLFGNDALQQAIDKRYFAFVELSFNAYPGQADFIAQQMATSRNYDLIAVVPFRNSFGRGHFFLWRSAAVAGQGNFSNVAQVKVCFNQSPRDRRACRKLVADHQV
jgi:hypothetical protein